MTDEGQQPKEYRIELAWPVTAHLESKMANLYSFVDDGSHVYLAFGFVPPIPNGLEPPKKLDVPVVGSYQLDRSLILNLRNSLTEYIDRNPQWFAPMTDQPTEENPPS